MKYLFFILLTAITSFSQTTEKDLNLMPWPQKIELKEGFLKLDNEFKINITGNPHPRIFEYSTQFLRRLDNRTGMFFKQAYVTSNYQNPSAILQVNCQNKGIININQDESYELNINNKGIQINAHSDLGAQHALETLLQLLTVNEGVFTFPYVSITDQPRFTWRGLMIDVARHYQPLDVLKRNLDAMSALKLNVFHWHLTDDQGWRIEVKKLPQLTELASDRQFYTQEEIKEIIRYASERGIMVVPEIDVPGHATALLTAIPEIGSSFESDGTPKKYSLERNAGIFNPTLDPTNPKTYIVLEQIFDEVCALFPSNYFHIGGDENEGKDWDANPKIQKFKQDNQLQTNHDLQTYFNMRLLKILQKNGKEIMGWEEIMTPQMSKTAIIHSWKGINEGLNPGESLINAAKSGYKTVLSNGFYIDLALGVKEHYEIDILNENAPLTEEEKNRILGGEATMWGELVTPLTIDSRIWPRTAAIAERFWSSPEVNDLDFLRKRLKVVSYKLEELGITHLKNKEVILRNISNNQDTKSLKVFLNICEPLKVYTRNKGGIEYQSYSPFTLFADACTPDAEDAILFEKLTTEYLLDKNEKSLNKILGYLDLWAKNHEHLIELSANAPLVTPLIPLSEHLKNISIELKKALLTKKYNNKKQLDSLLTFCNSKEFADVELAVFPSLKKLVDNIILFS